MKILGLEIAGLIPMADAESQLSQKAVNFLAIANAEKQIRLDDNSPLYHALLENVSPAGVVEKRDALRAIQKVRTLARMAVHDAFIADTLIACNKQSTSRVRNTLLSLIDACGIDSF